MKIVVSQPKKQHVAALLKAIAQKGWLHLFLSQLISNLIPKLPLPARFDKELRKRRYDTAVVPVSTMAHQGLTALFETKLHRVLKKSEGYLPEYISYDLWAAGKLKKLNYDVCIAYENGNLATFEEAKRRKKVTILDLAQVHHEDILRLMQPVWSPASLAYERDQINPRKQAALEVTDYVITLSDFARQSMVDNGWPAERIYKVNLGINPDIFYPRPLPKDHDEPFTFLFVGSIMLRKGIQDLLEVWRELQGQISAQLIFIGPMAEDARDLMASHAGAYRHYPFMHHEELALWMSRADVYVLPSLLDSWAQTVIEAMACGTAAIVSDKTGAQEAVRLGGGWVIPALDKSALKESIRYCCTHPQEVRECGVRAAKVAQRYTWADYHLQIQEVLKDIANRELL